MNLLKKLLIIGFCAVSISVNVFADYYDSAERAIDANKLMEYAEEVKKSDKVEVAPLVDWLYSMVEYGCDRDVVLAVIKSDLSFDDRASRLLSIKRVCIKRMIKECLSATAAVICAALFIGGSIYIVANFDPAYSAQNKCFVRSIRNVVIV
jgi:hypothetical protein